MTRVFTLSVPNTDIAAMTAAAPDMSVFMVSMPDAVLSDKPPLSKVVPQVINGGGAMPAFKGTLTPKQIADVSAYVVKATGGNPSG